MTPIYKSMHGWIIDWELLGIYFVCALFVFGSAAIFYVVYVPGDAREIAGTIVSFESTHKKDSAGMRHFLQVRLENGSLVKASAPSHITAKIGRHVKLTATRMPVVGIERFHFKEFNDPPADTNPLLKR